MIKLADKYRGREQSLIKHRFLTRYLLGASYKIFQGRSEVFNFVDAFAGPWNTVDSNDHSDTSFDQALKTLQGVRNQLEESGRTNLRIRFCFCEKKKAAFEELRRYAQVNKDFEIHVFHGKFEDHLNSIAAVCADGFTFTFIDPTGWDIDSHPVLEFLRERKGEFILNFMAEHINLHAGFGDVQQSFGRFLASPDWREKFDNLPENWSNERKILFLLKEKIKSMDAATYVPHFEILKPGQERIKMRLLLGTHSAHGVEVFRDVQSKIEPEETKIRQRLDEEKLGGNLFSMEEIAQDKQKISGIGSTKFQEESKTLIVELLLKFTCMKFSDLAVRIMEEVSMRPTNIKMLLRNMKEKGIIVYDLPPRKRVPQPDTAIRLSRR